MRIDEALQEMPRGGRRFPNAVSWFDGAGRFIVEVVGVNKFIFTQRDDGQWVLSLDEDY